MSVNNRMLKYLKEVNPPMAKCVIVSDIPKNRVILSYAGDKLLWHWDNGLMCPNSSEPVDIHPLSAESLIIEEIMSFLKMEGVESNEIIYINSGGDKIDGIYFTPPNKKKSAFDDVYKKEKLKELYWRFIQGQDKLSEELIGEAIAAGVLEPFLSLVNL